MAEVSIKQTTDFVPQNEPHSFVEPTYEMVKPVAQVVDDLPIEPWGARIVVEREPFKQRSRIYIPDTAQQKPTTGVVVGIGPRVEEDLTFLGQHVVFSLYAGIPLGMTNGKEYLVLHPDEILGHLRPGHTKDELNLEREA